jgi:hypothetical protein
MHKKNLLWILVLFLVSSSCVSAWNFEGNNVNIIGPLEDGSLPVVVQDQHSEIIDLRLSQIIAEINITSNTSINDLFVNISSGVAPQVSDLVCFKENLAFYQGEVLSVTSLGGDNYEIKVDKPLDFAFTTEGGCSIREDDWAVDGSLSSQTFSVSPSGLDDDVSWDITRVMLVCLGDGISGPDPTPDLSSFFTTDPIINGIVFRSVNGITKNIFNAKDNFHLVSETYDLSFYPANRFGYYGVTSRRTFSGPDKNGVTIRLDAITNDRFDLIIQDDLTDMEECHAVVQGHVVQK